MPGVTDVAQVDTGVAVRAQTFGQCIDAVRALDVVWNKGPIEGESDATILAELRKAEVPLAVPKVPVLAKTIEASFTFMFRSSAALEPYAAIADVRADRAEVWAGLKSPIVAQGDIAKAVGLPQDKVTVNVITGGGSFGHKLFGDHAIEAAKISKAMGKPVRLMWHRADEPRQGRVHPMCTSRIRATYLAGQVLSFEQRHTSVETDFSHGLGEMLTSQAAKLPAGLGNLGLRRVDLRADPGAALQLRCRHPAAQRDRHRFNTGSMRNIYSPDVRMRQRAGDRPAGPRDGQGPAGVPARVRQGRPGPCRAPEGGRGRQLGSDDAARDRPGHRDPQGVQGLHRRAWWRSTAAPRPSTARSATP